MYFVTVHVCSVMYISLVLHTGGATLLLEKIESNVELSLLSSCQATPLDKERQVLRRGRHPHVKQLPLQTIPTVNPELTTNARQAEPPSCLPGLPTVHPSLTPDLCSDPSPNPNSPSDSGDVSISSASSPVLSPSSPLRE